MSTTHKILVADDEPNIVISLEYLLKREGYQVVVARDGQEALDAITREHPDLVLLDVMMPHKTGFEVCQAVRSTPGVEATPILMLTALGGDRSRIEGLLHGADDGIMPQTVEALNHAQAANVPIVVAVSGLRCAAFLPSANPR